MDPTTFGPDTADLASASLAMARRFSAGATLWCTSPSWPSHAQHVAVEFVHPVIVGKRALPAVMVAGHRPLESLRELARAGDILLLAAGSDEPAAAELRQRARAWGLLTIWIGAGARPDPGAADYVLWVDGDETIASYGGKFVLLYHLLWESDARLLRAPRTSQAGGGRVHRRRLHHLLGRRTPGRDRGAVR